MKYNLLGNTGIKVSYLAFGTLTMGQLQKNMSEKEVEPIVAYATERGINFFDTAELYGSYHIVRQAVKHDKDVIISSKSYAYDRQGAEKALSTLLREIGRDYVDVFMLHETESEHTMRGHFEAVEYYMEMQRKGYIRALGISTHHIAAVRGMWKFPMLSVLHPIYNYKGLGIVDGALDEMTSAIQNAKRAGVGVYAMKAFGGGHLLSDRQTAADFMKSCAHIDSVAVGIQSIAEIDSNLELFLNSEATRNAEIINKADIKHKGIIIQDWCEGCGACAKACVNGALHIEGGIMAVDRSKCVLCGYCGAKCKNMAIKII